MSAEQLEIRIVLRVGDFDLDFDESISLEGVTAVFGPSGSGKSTLLRAISGFMAPDEGHVRCGTQTWFDNAANIDMPPHRRNVGFMFQHTCLFPHLDVDGNFEYAIKRRRPHSTPIERADVISALDLQSLLRRRVGSLSGGERQRVALGRTLLSSPRLLLLDEPLAALDRERKAEIIPYLQSLPRNFDVPAIYVSHDVDEIVQLADRALVMASGRAPLHGSIADAVDWLDLQGSTDRYDAGVLVEGRITGHHSRLRVSYVDLGGDKLTMPLVDGVPPGQLIRLRVRSRDVAIATHEPRGLSIRNVFPGRVVAVTGDDNHGFVEVTVETRGAKLRARITRAAAEDLRLEDGMQVFALIKSVTFERPS
ncbi:MAG: molybdenum ABC transporter ATP-binding protein [Woeseiaceae bacterium]|nr:molybdenum ABC transporter ATP-binding protein [Woeseiaceae bacterium]